jgi:anti-sigma B factor antagonist
VRTCRGAFKGLLTARAGTEDPMQLRLTTRIVNGVAVVDCNGRIVFGDEAAALRETVKSLITNNKSILLNLKDVTYIDSGGLGILVGLYTSARNNHAEVKLTNLTSRVGQLLQVTKLLTVFEVFDDEASALRSFTKHAATA